MPDFDQTGERSVIVTGGSGGIGSALCRMAAARGWRVWIGYASGFDRALRLAAEIADAGGAAQPLFLPLDDPARLREAVGAIVAEGALPGALALCASPPPEVASLLKLTAEQMRRQLECAVVGNHALLAEVWRRCFRPRGGGHVLAVQSAAQGTPSAATASHMAGYVVAKSALEALLRAAAAEFGRAGLRVSLVRPGYVETPMLRAFPPLILERARAALPGQSFVRPEQVAAALLAGLEAPPPAGTVAELPSPMKRAS